ncbi:MAG: hypothetical protein QOH68_2489 [Nocardioidaceae bacterium]|nr:hypothetical protein [Nocardioidaceae bacterium]
MLSAESGRGTLGRPVVLGDQQIKVRAPGQGYGWERGPSFPSLTALLDARRSPADHADGRNATHRTDMQRRTNARWRRGASHGKIVTSSEGGRGTLGGRAGCIMTGESRTALAAWGMAGSAVLLCAMVFSDGVLRSPKGAAKRRGEVR